jgi:predicted ATPase
MKRIRTNFYVITGGPGADITTLLEALQVCGFQGVPEVARQIIQEQVAIGGNVLHWGNRVAFRALMLRRSIEDYEREPDVASPVFFDRGIPGLIGYSVLIGKLVPDELREAVERYRYNELVFVAPPRPEIYRHDEERKQGWQEAVETCERVVHAYRGCGYQTVELPCAPIEQRVEFVLARVGASRPGVSSLDR